MSRTTMLLVGVVMAVTLTGCGSSTESSPPRAADPGAVEGFERTTVEVVASDVAAGRSLLVDVREPAEWAQGHAPTALHVPLASVDAELDRIEAAAKGRPILFICRSGSRSAQAAQVAVDGGLEQVASIDGGMQAWVDAGEPIVPASGSVA